MVFHVSWGDPGTNYLRVGDVHEMGATLDAIAEKVEGPPVVVFVDHEGIGPGAGPCTGPATQLSVLVGHPTRSSVRWTRYTTPVERYDAAEPCLPPFDGSLVCDHEGVVRSLPSALTLLSPTTGRRAVLDFVTTCGGRPDSIPIWTPPPTPTR